MSIVDSPPDVRANENLSTHLYAGFSVAEANSGFTISIGNIKVIDHSRKKPCLFAGRGIASFKADKGNFDVKLSTEERIPLRDFRVVRQRDYTDIIISSAAGVEVTLRIESTDSHDCVVRMLDVTEGYDWMWFRLISTEEEKIYGGGEQFSYLNLKGRAFPIWTREQGVGRDSQDMLSAVVNVLNPGAAGDFHTTYFPQASFISSRHFYCHVTGHNYKVLDFEQDSFTEIFLFECERKSRPTLTFGAGTTFKEVQSTLSRYLGHQPKLPKWIQSGAIIGVQGGTERMLEVLKTLQTGGVTVAALWIQDWCGKITTSFGQRVFWNWQWNLERYPGLGDEIKRLKDSDIRVLGYINPHLNCDGDLYKEAEANQYLMKNQSGHTYMMDFGEFNGGTIDLTNVEAIQWYKGIIKKNLIDLGFSGWMADFGEYIPTDGLFNDGRTGIMVHNEYPVMWAKLNREVVEESGGLGEMVFFMRAGGEGTQRYNLLSWAGDQNVNWGRDDGLASTIPAALSLGLSGCGLTHFDIGGYTSMEQDFSECGVAGPVRLTRSRELLLRSAEAAVFSPVMRTHEGNKPGSNAQIYNDDITIARFSRLVNLFKALQPYTESLMEENSLYGIPLQRPLFYHYESDPESYNIENEYLYGQDLLVAPVLKPGIEKWPVYLPGAETWISIYNREETYEGPANITVDAPLGRIPVFYRKISKWADLFHKAVEISLLG